MRKYTDFVEGTNGKAVVGASVRVLTYPGNVDAALFADEAGISPLPNPLTTDDTGKFSFYVANGRYTLAFSGSGLRTQTVTDVFIFDEDDFMAPAIAAATDLAEGYASDADASRAQAAIHAAAAAFSEAQAAAIVQGNFLQGGTGAQSRSFTSKAREVVSVMDYGAIGDGNTNLLSTRYGTLAAAQAVYPFVTALTQSIDWAAFTAAHNYFRTLGKRGTVIIPPGDYWLSETWRITNALTIVGAGGGEFLSLASTRLRFPPDVDGIRIHSVLAGDTPDPGKSATKTEIRDLMLYCPVKGTTGHGINATATINLNRVDVQNFTENGIRIFGSSAVGTGSANLWSIKDCRSNNSGGHGLFVSGQDVNAGVAINFDASNSGGWGIYDASLLGNTYVACHVNGSGIGSYKTTGGVAQNVFIGCYVEGAGNFRTELVQPTVVHGGVLNGENNLPFISITGDGTGAIAKAVTVGGVITAIHMQSRGTGYTSATATITQHGSGSGAVLGSCTISGGKITAIALTSGGTGYVGEQRFGLFKDNGSQGGVATNTMQFRLHPSSARGGVLRACSGTGNSLLQVLMDGDNTNGLSLSWNETQGTVDWIFANTMRVMQLGTNLSSFTGGRTTAITDGSPVIFPQGIWLGSGANARKQTVALTAPTSGEWARGDIVWALSPSAGGTVGWVCTTGGTAGSTAVFKTFGNIAA